ncbi:hypothetical protein [Chitinophaga sp.]|uniref:hypothetical protein n=1 Tax=Chitinophaga sp. TaxID=1869181 RepID=UPI002C7E20DB|nr:hypothetical protein [Chitinophaga sp.]HWV69784.1 hypothetical protein [Chitinophaga sp.]
MFRKLFTAVSLLIFTGLLVSAQDQAEAPAPVSQKKVSLDKAVPFTADSQQAKISGITVLSAVWDTARIGFLQTGLFNNKVGAVLGNYQVNAPVLLLFNNKAEAVPDKELMRLY